MELESYITGSRDGFFKYVDSDSIYNLWTGEGGNTNISI